MYNYIMWMFNSKHVKFEFPIIFFCENRVIFSENFLYEVALKNHSESVFQYQLNNFCDRNKPEKYVFLQAFMTDRFDKIKKETYTNDEIIGPKPNRYSLNFEMAREKDQYALVAELRRQ